MPPENQSPNPEETGQGPVPWLTALLIAIVGLFLLQSQTSRDSRPTVQTADDIPVAVGPKEPRSFQFGHIQNRWGKQFRLWWEDVPNKIRMVSADTGTNSNIRPVDYVGPSRCRDCHPDKHQGWTQHGHSRMTAKASAESVLGDFSGTRTIEYEGGTAHFLREDGKYLMDLKRNGRSWRFHITRTIGWRHFQDYAGYLISGPDELGHDRDKVEHVLPFSWDLAEQHFMPPVHLFGEHEIPDSFEPDKIVDYETVCSDCHNTYPVGDRILRYRGQYRWTEYSPYSSSLHIAGYFKDAHPELLVSQRPLAAYSRDEILRIGAKFETRPRINTVPQQGITCEACHYGGRAHAENSTRTNSTVLPSFFATSPYLFTQTEGTSQLQGRDAQNITFTCARCHTGERQGYANGLHAWNSTEVTEALNGSCYDPIKARRKGMRAMTCVTCHDPHQTVGLEWSRPPQEDDQICLDCHDQFRPPDARMAHTHHQPGNGDHCMDCHMPHTNEGLGQMVRTHRIVNPIDRPLIEANQPNACNLCHLDKPIDWTIDWLRKWYAPDFQPSEQAMASNYPHRARAVVYDWLRSKHQPTRIAAAGAVGRRNAEFALPALLEQLVNEPLAYTRRAMQKSADKVLGYKLRDQGFEYHLPRERRREIMSSLGLLKRPNTPVR